MTRLAKSLPLIRSNRIDLQLCLIISFPFLLVIVNEGWLFSYVLRGSVDPWCYFGYFLDLKNHLHAFAKTYFASRLPWILPGFLAYHFFSPIVATYLLFFMFYYAAIIPFYLIVKRVIAEHTALLTTLLMGSYFYFLEPMGSHYIDRAALTYLILTLFFLTKTNRLRFFFAGLFFGCMIYTQLFLITYTPLIALYYFYLNKKAKHKDLLFVVYGFFSITLLLCTINFCLNKRFFFFINSIRFANRLTLEAPNPFWTPLSLWWKHAYWLLFPSLVFVGSALSLIFQQSFFQLFFILTFLLHLVFETIAHQPVLHCHYYVSYMIPAMFVALGSLLSPIVQKIKSPYIIFFALLVLSLFQSSQFKGLNPTHPILLSCLLVLISIICFLTPSRSYSILALLLFPLSFGITNRLFNRWTPSDPTRNRNSFEALVESMNYVNKLDPKKKALFWYNASEPLGHLYRAINSTYVWWEHLVNEYYPQIHSPKNAQYPSKKRNHLFVLSPREDVLEETNKSLAQIGYKAILIEEKQIQKEKVGFKIVYLILRKIEE